MAKSKKISVEQKQALLREFCGNYESPYECGDACYQCPLRDRKSKSCYSDIRDVETNYEIVFGTAVADNVNHPSHYESGKFECIDVMEETQGTEATLGFCLCNAFKYLYRHNRKNGIEDIKKARWYIDKYIELVERGGNDG